MVIRAPAVQLLGRQRESDVLDRVLEAARDGRGGVLAVYGEPGVGKTALLDYVVEAGRTFGSPARSESKGRWSSHSRRSSSCARRASTSSSAFPIPSATRLCERAAAVRA
jgi:hypothetical protein